MSGKHQKNPDSQSVHSVPVRLLVALGLVALALALFWPATGFGFLNLDDPLYVRDNPHVNSGLSWENLRWAFATVHENWWLPLLWISFMLDTALFGPGPFGHHLVNVLLHAANAGLLFWALSRMFKSVWVAAFVAALFAVHPMRVEAVAWITARKDMLSGLFYMLALLAYLRHADRPSPARLAGVAGLMFLGLLSKAILITLPPVLLLLDYWPLHRAGDPLDRREWKTWGRLLLEKTPLILMAAVFVGINLFTHTTGRGSQASYSAATRLGLMPPNWWAYVGKILWPHPLAVVYPEYDVVVPWITALSLAGLVLATIALFRFRQKHPALLVGWLWFLISLLPVIRGLRMGIASMTDRFAYIPAIGLFLLLACAAVDFLPAFPGRRITLATAAFVLLAAGFATARAYLPLWSGSEPLFRHALAVTKNNYVAAVHVAAAMAEQDRTAEEIDFLRYALKCYPPCAVAHTGLARGLRESSPEEAARHLELAARFAHPREWDLHSLIGEQYALDGNLPVAIRHFRQSLLIQPLQTNTIVNLGSALLLSGQPGEALDRFDEALRLNPRNDRALFFRGKALLALDRSAEAIQSLRTAAYILPGKIEYESLLAVALSAGGKAPEAVARFKKLLRKNPDSPVILNNLACILAENPASPAFAPAAAVDYARQAVDLSRRTDPSILDTLALAQAANRQFDQALAVCAEAESLARQQGLADLAEQIRKRAEACHASARTSSP